MQSTENKLFLEYLQLIYQAPFRHKSTLDKVRRAIMAQDSGVGDVLYSLMLDTLERVDWHNPKDVEQAYKLIQLFSSSDLPVKPEVFANHAQRLSDVIVELIRLPNFTIIETKQPGNRCDLAHLVEDLLTLFFYHTGSSDELRAIGALLVLDFIKAFPQCHCNLVLSLVKYHPEAVEQFAQIINYYVLNRPCGDDYGILGWLSLDMFGLNAAKGDFEYKNAVKILQASLRSHADWTDDEIGYLIKVLFFTPLGLDFRTQAEVIAEKTQQINNTSNRQWKKTYKQELLKIETDFEGIQQKRWRTALRRVAVSKVTVKGIELIVKKFPEHEKVSILRSLLADADDFKNKPKLFDINNKPSVIFQDVGFKLLVIEELMYEQKLLKPMFTLEAFAAEYTKKEIDTNSNVAIPEVLKFYKNLDIPAELLGEVTELYQDSGIGGGAQIYYQMSPHWDPGCGDEVIKVKAKAIEDLVLLPNLKKITGLENSNISKKVQKQFEEKGILLEGEE